MRKSVMQHAFSLIPRAEIPRSSFDRSHGYKTTFDAGYLVPILVDEALPGDTFNVNVHALARLATPIFPIMDNMYMDTFFFAVPLRLLWDNWERFNGAQDNPDDSTDFTIPVVDPNNATFSLGSLADYFGLPTGVAVNDDDEISALPFRAYNLIWNEWFRDQNLMESINGLSTGGGVGPIPTGDGPDLLNGSGSGALLRRGKRHDYFTSCLPWPQKGDAVTLPMVGDAVVKTAASHLLGGAQNPVRALLTTAGADLVSSRAIGSAGSGNALTESTLAATPGSQNIYFSNLFADMTTVTAATINQLRQAFQVQRLLERDARGGTRYTEIIRSHFGVVSPDARLQRPEYLGGGSTPINITSVPQTSESATTPQGTLAAFGTANVRGHGFSKSFTEHCFIIGLVNVRADLTYQQGLNRMWSRQTRFDFYWPALSHIGEQAVLNKEIFFAGNPATSPLGDNDVFGYQERYAEYRYKPSQVTGLFRSNAAGSLDAWHLAQEFGSLPQLDITFMNDNPPIDRVIAVDTEPHFLFDAYISMRCARPMPMYGVPGMIDHF